jgi:hypothetical protein
LFAYPQRRGARTAFGATDAPPASIFPLNWTIKSSAGSLNSRRLWSPRFPSPRSLAADQWADSFDGLVVKARARLEWILANLSPEAEGAA